MENETPPTRKRSWLSRCIPSSVAGKSAVVTSIVLWVLLLFVWILRWTVPDLVPAGQALTWTQILGEVLLAVVIPIVLYWGIRRWNQVVEGIYPDIDQAWQAGVDALRAQGISIDDKPLYIVLGSSNEQQEASLIGALDSLVSVQGLPRAGGMRHALQWYANEDAIYLFCSGSSSLSALATRRDPAPFLQRANPLRPAQSQTQSAAVEPTPQATSQFGKALAASASSKVASAAAIPRSIPAPPVPPSSPTAGHLMTISADNLARKPSPSPAPPSPPATAEAKPSVPPPTPSQAADSRQPPTPKKSEAEQTPIVGTLFADQTRSVPKQAGKSSGAGTASATSSSAQGPPLDAGKTRSASQPATGPSKPQSQPASESVKPPARKLALPGTLDTSDQVPRLRYVCQLLKRARRPRCGINGVITLIPFDLSREGPLQLSALAQAARGDIAAIQEGLEIRVPVTAMLVGLEQDKGFNELVQRLQPELLARRLGGRFDIRTRPTPGELNVHSDRLCDTFEDWVYRLFGREEALLQQRGNRKLYGLISRIRHELKPRLRIVLGEAFGCESDAASDHSEQATSFFYSGCYFASSGGDSGQPAFIKGVLRDKLADEQSQVEWTAKARSRHAWVRSLIGLGWALTIVLLCISIWQWLR